MKHPTPKQQEKFLREFRQIGRNRIRYGRSIGAITVKKKLRKLTSE